MQGGGTPPEPAAIALDNDGRVSLGGPAPDAPAAAGHRRSQRHMGKELHIRMMSLNSSLDGAAHSAERTIAVAASLELS